MYVSLYTYAYPLQFSVYYFQWKISRNNRNSLFPVFMLPSVYIDSLMTQRRNFLRGSGILAVDCDVYICLSLIIYL